MNFQVGSIFSENSHYVYLGKTNEGHQFGHLGSGNKVTLSENYVNDLLKSGDYFTKEVKVGLEDQFWTKKQIQETNFGTNPVPNVGDLKNKGIRTIWENIHSQQVFTVCYKKADKALSKKAYDAKVAEVTQKAVAEIEQTKAAKKGVAKTAAQVIEEIIKNPILAVEAGEDRVLRGFKIQFTSRDGRYDCIDMDIDSTNLSDKIRPVNINTLSWLIFDGVKYIVE